MRLLQYTVTFIAALLLIASILAIFALVAGVLIYGAMVVWHFIEMGV